MGSQTDVTALPPPRAALLWASILTGPIAWAADLLIRYSLVHWSCGTQQTAILNFVSLVTLLLAVSGGIVAWRAFQRTPSRTPTDGGHPLARSRFMAMLGVLTSALFALVVVAGAVPQWVLSACD